MKAKKRKTKINKKNSFIYKLFIGLLVVIVLFVLVLMFVGVLKKEGFNEILKGKLGTINPFGKESIEQTLLIESSIHSGVSPIQESKGYIIELKSKPFFKNRAGGIVYKQQIREEHIVLKQQIEQNLGKTIGADIELLDEFEEVFNGIVLDISEQECNFLKNRINLIKNCYPNLKVHTLLDTSLDVMKINLAYSELGFTGKNVTIAVIDTGIDGTHESLDDLDDDPITNDPKIIGWKDFVNFRTTSYDDMGHGTHVAGIAAGTGGSAGIYRGVAPEAKLVGVKVLNSWGSGTFSDVIAGIEWTIQNKELYDISIISMSLGANVNGDGTDPVEIAATTAVENGINFVVAAGNAGPSKNTVGIPASAKKVITVGAIDDNKNIAGFSSRGPTKDNRIKPEVSAVGVDVISSVPKGDCFLCDSSGWMSLQGTSMATPHVAGVVALIKQANSSLNTEEIRELLMNTAEDKSEEGPDNTYGWGVVDTLQALLKIYPQEHELSVKNIKSQEIYDTNTPIKITAIIKNNGLNDETYVKVRFLIDGVEQGNRIINLIEADSEAHLDFIYVSEQEKKFKITISIDPVVNENIIFDNNLTKEITIKDYVGKIKAVVLDSLGTGFYQYSIFPKLNDNWFDYGDYKMEIDYETLNDKETTYELLRESNADVLIISDAWVNDDIRGHWEFSDSEIDAIKQYIKEGHGLIMTSGTLSTNGNVKNNMKLASLVGIDENSEPFWAEYMKNYDFDIYYPNHELFNEIDSYIYSYLTTVNLELNEQNPGDILAKSQDNLSIITGHNYGLGNTIYFANLPELGFGVYDEQIFYNAILWTSKNYEQKSNDLRLEDLKLESIINHGKINNISAKLTNKGSVSENNIKVKLIIDDIEMQNFTIPFLEEGEKANIDFNFTLTETGTHSVFIEVEETVEETKTYDNLIGKNVFVPRASLTGIVNDYGIDEDNDGLYDFLAIDVELNAVEPSNFLLKGILTSQLGVELETSYEGDNFSPGLHNSTLIFNGLELRRMGLNGPYKLQNLELSDEQGTLKIDYLYETGTYNYNNFESYPDLSIYDIIESQDKIIVNHSAKVEVEIQNTGTENAFDVNVSLYREDWETESLILINSSVINNISVSERESIVFEITSEKIGYVQYLINISNNEDGDLRNNYYVFNLEVLAESADVKGDFDYINKAIINHETILTAFIENDGVEEAQNVSVNFYKELGWNEYEFLYSEYVGAISVDEIKEVTLSITPTEIGELKIIGNISADNEINKENNRFYKYLDIVQEGPDVTGNFYSQTYPVLINQEVKITVQLENIGTQKANNVKATLYEDVGGILNEIARINKNILNTDENYYEEILWTPTMLGYINLILKITADNDTNLENNDIEKSINVKLESPDVYAYFNYFINKLILNQENIISVRAYNEGIIEAQNVFVSLYLNDEYYNGSDWVDNSTLISSENIGNIETYGEKDVNFSYTPTESGWIDFKVNISADNEVEEYKENNEYYRNLKVVSGADLSVYTEYMSTTFINQEKNIISYLTNNGVEDALNVIVSSYENILGDWALVDSQNLGSLAINEFIEVSFLYTPTELGYTNFKINISADNEGNYNDNDYYFGFQVVDNGPDIDVDLQTWKINNAVINNEVSIPAEIANTGNQDASNILITLYNVSWDAGEQLTQIGQMTIPSLLASGKTTVEFPYTPMESGWIDFKLESTLAEDVYSNNDDDYGNLYVLSSLTDVSGLFLFYDSYAINNETSYLDIEVRDNDIIGAQDVIVELYDDGNLVNSFFIPELNASDIVFFKDVEWTPTYLGNHNLTLIVTADDDINLENNVYTEFIEVYDKKNVRFNIRNYSGVSQPGYLIVNENKFWVENSPHPIEFIELSKADVGVENNEYNDISIKDTFTVFLDSELKNEMNITSGYYEIVSDGNLSFNLIYANKPGWSYENLSYYILYYDLEQDLSNASVYGCAEWNFSNLSCQSEWIKNNKTLKYVGDEGIYITGEFDNGITAIGLVNLLKESSESLIPTPAPETTPSTGNSGGSGGSSGGSASVSRGKNPGDSETVFFNNKNSTEPLRLEIDNPNIDIEFLGLKFVNEQQGRYIQFKKIDSLIDIPEPIGKIYAYFEIIHESIENENIKEGNIIFKVTQQWLIDNNLNKEDIILLKYEDSWRELPVYPQNSDSIYNYYRADINSLSIFAISAKQSEIAGKHWFKIWIYLLIIIILIISLIIIILFLRYLKKRHLERYKSKRNLLMIKAKNFVEEERKKGVDNKMIKEKFKRKGWEEKDISKLMGV